MSVVLRCPTCGTTQGHLGECEACSEGEVRYFCTNHDEGIWLDGALCNRCGGEFGDAPTKHSASGTPRIPTRPAGAPDFRAPGRGRTGPPPEPDFSRRAPRRPDSEEPPEPEVLPPTPLGELLEEMAERARTRGRHKAEVPWAEPPARSLGLPLAGCFLRAVGLVVLLIVAVIIFLLLLFGGFIIR